MVHLSHSDNMQSLLTQEQAQAALRNAIEDAVGRKMVSPHDFDFLAQAIYSKIGASVSINTLKRFWGYQPNYVSPRMATLDILSQFLNYKDWQHFCATLAGTAAGPAPQDVVPAVTSTSRRAIRWGLAALLLIIIVVGGFFLLGPYTSETDAPMAHSGDNAKHVIRRGQIFDTCGDYLRLFGITAADHYWDQPLPHNEGIIIWGPEYHHPQWHNDGDRDSLMPTITEWWEPDDSLDGDERKTVMDEKNKNLFFTVMRTKELRITFMKNLTDTGYVFLGIYRTSLEQSDSTHVVWERVADECDLSDLTYLQQLRH